MTSACAGTTGSRRGGPSLTCSCRSSVRPRPSSSARRRRNATPASRRATCAPDAGTSCPTSTSARKWRSGRKSARSTRRWGWTRPRRRWSRVREAVPTGGGRFFFSLSEVQGNCNCIWTFTVCCSRFLRCQFMRWFSFVMPFFRATLLRALGRLIFFSSTPFRNRIFSECFGVA